MQAEPTTPIAVPPDSELGTLLDRAEHAPVRLEKDGIVYVLRREGDTDYDPDRIRKALDAYAGTMSEEEGDRLKANIYRWRDEDALASQ